MSSKKSRSERWRAKLQNMGKGDSIFLEGVKPSELTHVYAAARAVNIKVILRQVDVDEIYLKAGTRVFIE